MIFLHFLSFEADSRMPRTKEHISHQKRISWRLCDGKLELCFPTPQLILIPVLIPEWCTQQELNLQPSDP